MKPVDALLRGVAVAALADLLEGKRAHLEPLPTMRATKPEVYRLRRPLDTFNRQVPRKDEDVQRDPLHCYRCGVRLGEHAYTYLESGSFNKYFCDTCFFAPQETVPVTVREVQMITAAARKQRQYGRYD